MASCPAEAQYFYLNSNSVQECTPSCKPTQGLFLNSDTDKLIFLQNQQCKAVCANGEPADAQTLACLPDCNNNGTNIYQDYDTYQGGNQVFKWCLSNCVATRFFYQVGTNQERICTSQCAPLDSSSQPVVSHATFIYNEPLTQTATETKVHYRCQEQCSNVLN